MFVLSYHNWQKMQVKCEFRYFLKFFKFFSKKHLHFLQTSCIISEYGSLVKRLRRRPLTAKTGVRFPYELLKAEIIKISAFFVFAPSVLHILCNLGNSHIYLRNLIPCFIVSDTCSRKIEYLLELSHGICGVLTI